MAQTYSRRQALRTFGVLGAAAGLGGFGIACGDDRESGGDAATPVPVLPSLAPTRSSRSGRLRLGVLRSSEPGAQSLSRLEQLLTYSGLVAVDPRDASVHGDVATSFEIAEPLEVRFSVRTGIFLHADVDGLAMPLTAELVARDLQRAMTEEEGLLSTVIEAVEAPDDTTLLVRLRAPFSLLFELLGAPEARIRGSTRYSSFTDPVGSGPFVPAGQDASGNALVANQRFHDTDYPLIEQINVLHFADEGDLDTAFLASQLDVRHHPSALSLKRVLERRGTQRMERPARTLRGLGLSLLPNKGGLPTAHLDAFQDERVRRAVSLSVDRELLASLDGSAVASPVGAAHRADSLPSSELSTHPLYQHDPAGAAKLLQAAGAESSAFRILTPEQSNLRQLSDLVSGQLRGAGFDAMVQLEDEETWSKAFFAGDFEASLFELDGFETPDVGLRLHTGGGVDSNFSLWGYSNPVFDASVNAALSELVPERRASAFREAQRVLLEDAPGMFPLVTPTEVASAGSRVVGYAFDAFDFNAGWLAAQWERPA